MRGRGIFNLLNAEDRQEPRFMRGRGIRRACCCVLRLFRACRCAPGETSCRCASGEKRRRVAWPLLRDVCLLSFSGRRSRGTSSFFVGVRKEAFSTMSGDGAGRPDRCSGGCFVQSFRPAGAGSLARPAPMRCKAHGMTGEKGRGAYPAADRGRRGATLGSGLINCQKGKKFLLSA